MIILRKTRFQEFADVKELSRLIAKLNIPDREIKILNVCGSHEHVVCKWGLRQLLPFNIKLIPGPGCPVCVTPQEDILNAMEISKGRDVLLATYGDMLRVPAGGTNLRSCGGNVVAITSCHQVLDLCRKFPEKKVVFFSIGFETTAAPAATLFSVDLPSNFFFVSSHRLTTAAMESVMESGPDAFVAPGHVSAVMGKRVWEGFSNRYRVPVVVAGFTPEDVLLAVLLILKQLREGRAEVENIYRGVVRTDGNRRAKELMNRVFIISDAKWRGLGVIPHSGLELKEEYSERNAKIVWGWKEFEDREETGCICGSIIRGKAYPSQCKLFGNKCRPHTPVGPCMVSAEGACNIWYRCGAW